MPSTPVFNPLTQSDIDKQLKRMEYDLAKERVEPYIVDMSKELPAVLPLVSISGSCICSVGDSVKGSKGFKKGLRGGGLKLSARPTTITLLKPFLTL